MLSEEQLAMAEKGSFSTAFAQSLFYRTLVT